MMATKQALVAGDHVTGWTRRFSTWTSAPTARISTSITSAPGRRKTSITSRASRRGSSSCPAARTCACRSRRKQPAGAKEFDLIVLSVGMEPPHSLAELAARLDIKLNEYGFCDTDRLLPLSTSRPGVFVGGAAQEPKDIPETVTQASAAASMAMELLAPARNSLVTKKSYPTEHDVADEEPRLGVFVCHCGMNIALGRGRRAGGQTHRARAERGSGDAHHVHLRGHQPVQHQGHDPSTPAQPHRGGLLHPAHARAVVPRNVARSRPEPVPVRNGQHPRPMFLGAFGRAAIRHRKGG